MRFLGEGAKIGGYVFVFVLLYVCQQGNSRSCRRIKLFFMDGMYSNKPFDFRADANHFPELGNY